MDYKEAQGNFGGVHCLDCDDGFKVHTPIKSHKIACFKYVQFTLCYTLYNI